MRAHVLHFNLTFQSEEELDFMEMDPVAPLMDLPVGSSNGSSRFGGNSSKRGRGSALDNIRNMVVKSLLCCSNYLVINYSTVSYALSFFLF